MYIDYTKLWKLLVDKNMSRGDLMALTGISSRVLAKLSKNETVTTDTIARICEALSCDVGDIMECASEASLTLYAAYKKLGKVKEKNERYTVTQFDLDGRKYLIYRSKRTATKSTNIICNKDGSVLWKQIYPIGYVTSNQETTLFVDSPRDTDSTIIVIIKGKPGFILGLDENGFVSSRGKRKSKNDVYLMSEAAFKLFEGEK